MDLSSGYPFWLIRDGLPFSYEQLDRDIKTEVVIMGGGISGALAAWYLAKAGIGCIVVDKRSIGLGSTCASTSLLQYEIDTPLSELANLIGKEKAIRAYKLCEQAIGELKKIATSIKFAEFQLKDSLYYAAVKKDSGFIKEEFNIRKASGFDVTLLDADEIKSSFGFKAPAAILSAEAAQVDAYGLTHGILQHVKKKGVEIYDRTEIETIRHSERGVKLTTGQGHLIRARYLVFATGYEVVKYIDKKIVDLNSTYAVISEQANKDEVFWKDDALIWNTADPYLYMRNTKDRRIIVGGRDEKFSNPARRDKLLSGKRNQLTADFHKIFPHIPFKPEFSWTGTFGSTKDGLPYIGKYNRRPSGLFSLGFGGNGITFSQVAAVLLRDIILGKKNDDAAIFSFNR